MGELIHKETTTKKSLLEIFSPAWANSAGKAPTIHAANWSWGPRYHTETASWWTALIQPELTLLAQSCLKLWVILFQWPVHQFSSCRSPLYQHKGSSPTSCVPSRCQTWWTHIVAILLALAYRSTGNYCRTTAYSFFPLVYAFLATKSGHGFHPRYMNLPKSCPGISTWFWIWSTTLKIHTFPCRQWLLALQHLSLADAPPRAHPVPRCHSRSSDLCCCEQCQ